MIKLRQSFTVLPSKFEILGTGSRITIAAALCCGVVMGPLACQDADPFPVGPCNDDGETRGGSDEVGDSSTNPPRMKPSSSEPAIDSVRPNPFDVDGWAKPGDLDGYYRFATSNESRRFDWPEHTLVVATPLALLSRGDGGEAWVSVPVWSDDEKRWLLDTDGGVAFYRRGLSRIQSLALGHFIEHRHASNGSRSISTQRPIFEVLGAVDSVNNIALEVVMGPSGEFLLRATGLEGNLVASFPHTRKQLDIHAPAGYHVSIISPAEGGITRDPLSPYDCENGECDDPDDPLDECNDEIDNDGDGHRDLCDWNCLPHADFGADAFPEAASRVENGKTYALMGGGSICTVLGDTWMVEFADMALKASELLNDVRPDVEDAVHFRIFSCWVFESHEALMSCQYGLCEEVGEDFVCSEPVCPPGMEDYPYQPTETDMINSADQANLLFEEATRRAWSDLELNTHALGKYGEPVNGVVFVTSDTLQTCMQGPWPFCAPAAGLAYKSPDDVEIQEHGSAVVTNANAYDWHTLAHEVGHTLGLCHDTVLQGFMNDTPLGGALPILGTAQDDENFDNNGAWEKAFMTKGWLPRSSGWYHTGCSGFAECAPLGKPGWSCNGLWCVEDAAADP